MTDLSSLLSRVLAADGPDRELDAAIAVAFRETVPSPPFGELVSARSLGEFVAASRTGDATSVAPYTASLDAALALVERVRQGWGWTIARSAGYKPEATLYGAAPQYDVSHSKAATAALALLAALIKSKMEMENEKDSDDV